MIFYNNISKCILELLSIGVLDLAIIVFFLPFLITPLPIKISLNVVLPSPDKSGKPFPPFNPTLPPLAFSTGFFFVILESFESAEETFFLMLILPSSVKPLAYLLSLIIKTI